MKTRSVRAALTWIDGAFHRDVRLSISPDGTIESISRDDSDVDLHLPDEALLPGMINAHTHSFQRAMRGHTETFPSGRGSFWTWRETMYRLATSMNEQQFYDWNLAAFEEMRAAGVTTVGEFHYFHHSSVGNRDHELDTVILEAAAAARIRIVLLQAFYKTGGLQQPLSEQQKRFETPDVDAFLRTLDRIGNSLGPNQSLGIVAHSVRAVPAEDIERLAAEAVSRDLPFHIHLEEQRREVEESLEATGSRPMRQLLDRTHVDDHFTGVHCTHSAKDDLHEWLERGANVCITPLTEGNLGDGIQPEAGMAAGQLSVGSDCNARIDMLEELRWLEYAQRLMREDRGVYRDSEGRNGRVLFDVGTQGGARSLRVDAGRIEEGAAADFFTVDLNHRTLRGWSPDTLLDTIIFGGGNEIIRRNCVAGDWMDSNSVSSRAGNR